MERPEAKALGLKHYATGRPCCRGHLAERLTSNGVCLECNRLYYHLDREDRLKRVKERYAADPQNAWCNRHPEKRKAATARWRERGDNAQAWRKKHPEKARAAVRNRRAKRKKNGGTHTAADIAEILHAQRKRCAYCKKKLGKHYHVDHIMPIVLGGSNHRSNLQILCPPCNRAKHASDPLDFTRSMGFLI